MNCEELYNNEIFVIIPVYNAEKYIERCLQSIMCQTWKRFRVLLIDDGSTDNSGQLCDKFAEKDSRITVLHQSNMGVSATRNAGINYVLEHLDCSNSGWISFVDSDDYVHPNYLEFLLRAVKSVDLRISCCSFSITSGEDVYLQKEKLEYHFISPEELWSKNLTNAVVAWGKLYSVDCFRNIRYPVGRICEDEFTTYKLLFSEQNIAYIKQPLYFYYTNMSSIMHSIWKPARMDGMDAIDEQLKYFKEHGFENAYTKSLAALCEHCIKSLRYIEVQSPTYDYLKPVVHKRTKKALKQYAKKCGWSYVKI